MDTIDNLLNILRQAHCDNAQQAYYAKRHPGRLHSTMPATSFVFEFFLFNSLYQYDWSSSFNDGVLVPWPRDELTESAQQTSLERFMKTRCHANPAILRRAFCPLTQIHDLDGPWTRITPDARITVEEGRRFFTRLSRLRDLVRSDGELAVSRSLFRLIGNCRRFAYLVRNNIFHGSKSLGSIYDRDQRRRIETYDLFLKSLVSLFFLSVDDGQLVGADYVQLPIRIPFGVGDSIDIGQSRVADLVASGDMKPEDSRLIGAFFSHSSTLPERPGPRDALFYPSSGNDLLAPLLLGLPFCSQFFFYERARRSRAEGLAKKLRGLLDIPSKTEALDDGELLQFDFRGTRRTVHLVRADNKGFLSRDVDLTFYFHRGDSPGEGGSGQGWDSLHVVDLGHRVAEAADCQILTDGEPGGLHPALRARTQIVSIPISHRRRDYFLGNASSSFLREVKTS